MAASSASSSSGCSASSRRSFSISACWLSFWLLTETYSPNAIEMAPPTTPAAPAIRMGPDAVVGAQNAGTEPVQAVCDVVVVGLVVMKRCCAAGFHEYSKSLAAMAGQYWKAKQGKPDLACGRCQPAGRVGNDAGSAARPGTASVVAPQKAARRAAPRSPVMAHCRVSPSLKATRSP